MNNKPTAAAMLKKQTKKRDFLLCIDADGCIMDVVRTKQMEVLCPELIRTFGLEDVADFVTEEWEEITLRAATRGISRFEALVLLMEDLHTGGVDIPGAADIKAWVARAESLSAASLRAEVRRTGSLALRKLEEWNNSGNRRIRAMQPTLRPFPGVEEHLRVLHTFADIAVVSGVEQEHLEQTWQRCGLAPHTDFLLGQGSGTKEECLAALLEAGYPRQRLLLVGDSLPDAGAAAANGVAFAPVLPGREEESWLRLQEETLPKLLHGTFGPEYQNQLTSQLRNTLRG